MTHLTHTPTHAHRENTHKTNSFWLLTTTRHTAVTLLNYCDLIHSFYFVGAARWAAGPAGEGGRRDSPSFGF